MVVRGKEAAVIPFNKWHRVKNIERTGYPNAVYITMCGLPIRKVNVGEVAEYPDTRHALCTSKACGLVAR